MTSDRPVRLGILSALLVLGCGEAPSPDARPRTGGTAVVAGSSDLQNLIGPIVDEQTSAEVLKYALSTTLIRLDDALAYAPYAAREWTLEGDSAAVFRLREGLAWHDGRPTTARDVVFTFERVKDPETGSPLHEMFAGWEAAQILDSLTVRFTLRPHPDPLYPWTELPLVPAHALDTVPATRLRQAAYGRRPIGNGPFRFVSHRENDRWVFEANPDFPTDLGGRPHLDRLVWRVIPESAAQVAELRTGRAHLAMSPRTQHLEQLRGDTAVRVIQAPSNMYAFIGWNVRRPALSDPRVRRALTHAIDRGQLLEGLRGGYGEVAFGPVPPGHWAHHDGLEPLPYDPEESRTLLAAAGWTDSDGDGIRENAAGEPLEIELKIPSMVDFSRDLAEVVRGDLADVGVRMTTRPLEAATLFADITGAEKRFDAVLLTLAADFRMDLRDTFHSRAVGQPYQLSSWSQPEADSLMDGIAAAPTREAATPLWHGFQEVLRREQPWTFLYYAPSLRAARTELLGVRMDGRGTFVSLPEWWLAAPADSTAPASAAQ